MAPEEIVQKLTASQKLALTKLVTRGNSPLGVSGQSLNSLWQKGLVIGGRIYGSKTWSYRFTELGARVANCLSDDISGVSNGG